MAKTEQEIFTGLAGIIDEVIGVPAAELNAEASLVDDLGIDSLSMVEILSFVQGEFGVEIPDQEIRSLKTVQDVVSYVRDSAVSV